MSSRDPRLVDLAVRYTSLIAGGDTWDRLAMALNDLAREDLDENDTGGLQGWQPTRIRVEWKPRAIDPEDKIVMIEGAARAIRRAETFEAGLRSVIRITTRAARLAGVA